MILQSVLTENYPVASIKKYLTGDTKNLDPKFAGRLAKYAKDHNVFINITDGYRSYNEQKIMYDRYKKGYIKSASKPGVSWHEFSLAVDTSTKPIRQATNAELAKYGLCKPLKSEGWHIQPIETLYAGTKANKKYAPIDLSPKLQKMFKLSSVTTDYFELHDYPVDLALGLLSGKKEFTQYTMNFLMRYKYWDFLKDKLSM